jgi:CRP-like cAMP-binding protein
VGSALLLTGAESKVDVVTVESSRLLQWEAKTLEQYLNAHSETRNAFQRHLVRDLAGKVQHLGVQPS